MNAGAKQKVVGLTGPSVFTDDARKMIEDPAGLDANYVELSQDRWENVEGWLRAVDGVVLAGGIDIHPTVYGQDVQAHSGLSKFDIKRDMRELRIARWCLDNKKPMLAICRGHQLLSIVKGLGDEFVMDIGFGSVVHQPSRHGVTLNREEPCHAIRFRQPEAFSAAAPPERKVFREVLGERIGHLGSHTRTNALF